MKRREKEEQGRKRSLYNIDHKSSGGHCREMIHQLDGDGDGCARSQTPGNGRDKK